MQQAPYGPPETRATARQSFLYDALKWFLIVFAVGIVLAGAFLVFHGLPQRTTLEGLSQMNGAEWITLSRSRQDDYTKAALKDYRCPSDLSTSDISLLVSQRVESTGLATNMIDAFARTFTLIGCTPTQ